MHIFLKNNHPNLHWLWTDQQVDHTSPGDVSLNTTHVKKWKQWDAFAQSATPSTQQLLQGTMETHDTSVMSGLSKRLFILASALGV